MQTQPPIRILLIEDDPVDAELVRRQLQRIAERQPSLMSWQEDLASGLDAITRETPDVVLLDLGLPDSRDLSTLTTLRDSHPDVPVVVFTVGDDLDQALLALEAGAQDYLVKDELRSPGALMRSIRSAIERSRIAREKLASLGVLSAGVAMGFNRVLGSILESADQAAQDLHDERRLDRVQRELNEIRRVALRGGEMAGRLRDYSVMAPMVPHALELSDFVRQSAELIGSVAPASVDISYRLASRPVTVRAGRLQLHELLLALVQNAAEAIGEGPGRVCVATDLRQVDSHTLRESQGSPGLRPGPYAWLSVEDSGPGMDEATRRRIFDPFFTTKAAGRGLGLAAAMGVARQCRGAIRVESAPGEGSHFDVLLPCDGAVTGAKPPTQMIV